MYIPESFQRSLQEQFDGRLRVRWSPSTSTYQIEQRFRAVRSRFAAPNDDEAIRDRDGFQFILAVAPGDRSRCPKCQRDTKIAVKQFKESRCEHCEAKLKICHFPLDESLLQHLRYTDPYRGGLERLQADLEASELAIAVAKQRDLRNKIESATKDDFKRLVGISQFGYTGREQYA